MKNIICLLHILFLITAVKAEEYYCWSISGLNIRDTPSPTGNILGKLDYGQKINVDSNIQDDYRSYEDLFLIGINEDNSADIKFKGWWLKIEFGDKIGYVFSGYLSRYPNFKIIKEENQFKCETFKNYMVRNYKLLNYDTAIWTSNIFDNKIRSFSWDQGITVINDHNEKGASVNIIFADMTFNEALLLVKFYFQLFEINNPTDRNQLLSSRHYYGLSVSNETCEINFPAPDGQISILKLRQSIVISYYGSC